MRVSGIEIDAILFDFDNTLVDRDMAVRRLGAKFYEHLNLSSDVLGIERFVEEFSRIDRSGTVPDKKEQMASVMDSLELTGDGASELESWWNSEYPKSFVIDSDSSELLQQLTENEVPWGIVSNGSPLQMDVVRAVGLDRMARTTVISSLINIRKPDMAIFELARMQTDATTPAERFMFVGDNPVADVRGANGAGMKTAWVSRSSEWELVDCHPDISITTVGDLRALIETG